jgi:peptidoglycan hydrolase-like amidase
MSSNLNRRGKLTRRQFAGGLTALLACSGSSRSLAVASPASFGVFSLFEPQEMTLQAEEPLLLILDDDANRRYLLAPNSPPAVIRWKDANRMTLTVGSASFTISNLRATTPSRYAARFTLEVPLSQRHGSIRRGFLGSLTVTTFNDRLLPVIAIDLETAVGSIVGAESRAGAPLESLMAQAAASRSFLLAARTVHVGFDFCDTTHCQYLRGPALPGSPAELAAARTAGLSLQFGGHPIAAMYSRSCSGQTHSLAELGYSIRDYPYYSVSCEYCLNHPETWEREMPQDELPGTEHQRIVFARIHGWSAIPSRSFTLRNNRLYGRGIGHGIGMCQRGAMDMAKKGARFETILAHYYPNTVVG